MIAKPFTAQHLKQYQDWHGDRELSRRASYPDYTWFNYATADLGERGLVAFENERDDFVSLAQFDLEDQAMVLFIAVNPKLRKQGLGKATLAEIISAAPLSITRIEANIEQDNMASSAMVRAYGFYALDETPDQEGFLRWRFTL